MFVSHDTISPKKKIQKPNILRRKTKPSNVSCLTVCESLRPGNSSVLVQGPSVEGLNFPKKYKSVQVLKLNSMIKSHGEYEDLSLKSDEADQSPQQYFVDNSYFLKDLNEDIPLLDNVVIKKDLETNNRPKWMEFINNKVMIEPCDVESIYIESAPETSTTVVPISTITILNTSNMINDTQGMEVNTDVSSSGTITNKLKCDINECNKEFSSEQKLKKHKGLHNKDGSIRSHRQTTIECPVKETQDDGSEKSCGRIFKVREELAKHLNEDHTQDEAAYKCLECGRSFFWATGLRAHGRSHTRRTALACTWPGCGRVFRQPCRLREHTRAHTGDKPYPCQHPNCGWSFRTASKLLRHARRHTGERRHVCADCGRAFLRREHLREHAARHHAPRPHRHACTAPNCQQTFTNMSSLYTHMKKVHKHEEKLPPTDAGPHDELPRPDENMFMISLLNHESELVVPVELEQTVGMEEAHAARTHCTWPLDRAPAYAHATGEQAVDKHEEITQDTHAEITHDAYILGEDVHVEQSEGAESNIYTIRSDLFLHGNVIHNEDSEHMSRAPPLDADLLLDAPSVHIAQEELYSDAVDESSFRVFLLNAEELQVAE